MVAIERDDYITLRTRKASFVTSAIAANILTNDLSTQAVGDIGGAVGRAVVHHNDLVHKLRHLAENLLNSLFFIQTRDDDRDFQVFVQTSIVAVVG